MNEINKIAHELKKLATHCEQCGRKPDFLYFDYETKKILSVICTSCRAAFENAILSIGTSNCSEPNCEDCETNRSIIKKNQQIINAQRIDG